MKQTIIKIMKKKQPKWKPIKMGERLPCQSFLRKKNGEILKLSTVAGIKVGQDAYYIPVDDVIEEIKNYPIEESEDEMICRKLIAFLKQCKGVYGDGFKQFDLNIDDAIAWLEKKGEQKHQYNSRPKYIGEEELLGEQNHTDKVKPKFKVGDFIQFNGMGHTRYTVKEVCGLSHYINTCNKRMDMSYTDANFELVEQKPAEWSEEDENIYNAILDTIYNNLGLCSIHRDWFKNIKERLKSLRPQSQWKPSDEHYELEEFAKIVRGNLTGISKAVQKLFEAKYLQLTGNKMYGGFKD